MKKLLVGLVAVVFCVSLMLGCDENETLGAVAEVDNSRPFLNNEGGEHLWTGTIRQSSDDCSEETDTLDLTSPDVTLSLRNITYQYVGLRFEHAEFRRNVDIDSAFFKLSKAKRTCGAPGGCNFSIYGAKEISPPTWSSSQKPSGITPTDDTVFASITDNGATELHDCLAQQTYDVTDIVIDIQSLTGWDSGQAIVLVVKRKDFCNNCVVNWQSYDFVPDSGSAGDCSAILEVYYSRDPI